MGAKLKRKASKSGNAPPAVEDSTHESSSEEPVVKRSCLSSGRELVQALKGPDTVNALKSWLYLISNAQERAQLDKESTLLEQTKGISRSSGLSQDLSNKGIDKHIFASNDEEAVEEREDLNVDDEQGSGEDDLSVEHLDSFLLAGGSPSDLVCALPISNDATYANSRYVFKVLAKVLLRIAAAHREKVLKASKTCQELLNSYSRVFKNMLESNKSFAPRRLALELLTALVVLDSKLGKEILYLPVLNSESVQNLTSCAVPIDVRVAYLNFLVALLMEEDDSLITTVMNKPWLVTCLMDDLQYDICQSLVLFLTILQKAVVRNPHITKTSKLTIFDYNSILCLLRLYKWKGPLNRPRARSLWDVKKAAARKRPLVEIDHEKADIVADTAHELLLLLLTDYRLGIVFRDPNIGFKGDRLNSLVVKVIQKIGQFWEHPKTSELIANVLAACPDAMGTAMASMEPFISPRSSPQWFKCVDFLKRVILAQRPGEMLQRQASKLSARKFTQAAIEMCAPPNIVKALCIGDASALCDSDANVAQLVYELLVTMLRRIWNFMEEVSHWSRKGIPIKFVAVRHLIREMLPPLFPSLMSVEKSWKHWNAQLLLSLQDNEDHEEPMSNSSNVLPVLSSLLELLESLRRVCPAAVETFFFAHSSFKLSMKTAVLSVGDSEDAALLRNRFYHLLLAAHDQTFNLENEGIREHLLHLFADLLHSFKSVRSLSSSALQMLIERTRFLEGSQREAQIWLNAYQETFYGNEERASEFKKMIVESIMRATARSSKYLDVIARCEEECAQSENKGCLTLPSPMSLEDLLKDGATLSCDVAHSDPKVTSFRISSVSPWLPALLEVLNENLNSKKMSKRRNRELLERFMTKLVVHLIFRFPHPLPPLHLILRDASESLSVGLSDYLRGWLPGNEPKLLTQELLGDDCVEVRLSMNLFSVHNSSSERNEVLELVHKFVAHEAEDSQDNEICSKVIQLTYFCVFHVTQWMQLNLLTCDYASNCQEILFALLKIASHFDKSRIEMNSRSLVSECLEVVFSHPLLLQQFAPLSKHNVSPANLLTNLLTELANFAKDDLRSTAIISPYKVKVLSAVVLAVKKMRKLRENPVPLVDAFRPAFCEVVDLLRHMSDLPSSSLFVQKEEFFSLSHWCSLVSHLLTYVTTLRSQDFSEDKALWVLSPTIVSQVAAWLIDLLQISQLDSSPLQHAFLSYLQSCPQHTSLVPKQLLSSLLNAACINSDGESLAAWLSRCARPRDVIELLKFGCKPGRSLLDRPGVLLAVLDPVLKSPEVLGVVGSNWFKVIYDHHRRQIEQCIGSLAEQPNWLSANIDVIVTLVEYAMSAQSRQRVYEALETSAPLISSERSYQLKLIVAVLKDRQVHLLRILIVWLADALKKHDTISDEAPLVHDICVEILHLSNRQWRENVTEIRDRSEWLDCIKLALKLGLRLSSSSSAVKGDELQEEGGDSVKIIPKENDVSSSLLKTLTCLFKILYTSEENHEHVTIVHKMTTQHSEFLNTMMDSCASKVELVRFLHVLVTLHPSNLDSTHVPILLAAYGATTSRVDCALLQLLQVYERSGMSLSHFRPYLWGKEAANHYSVWSDSEARGRTLWHQPKPNQVLGLLNKESVKATIAKFPVNRKLNINEDKCDPLDSVYDPSFYLSLFSHLLAPESPVSVQKFVQSGALAITFSCLASHDVAMRAAAYTTLARFVSHLHMASGSNKQVLLQLMSSIQQGVLTFGDENPQLPSISSVFLAQAALELANPVSTLYQPLMRFVLSKPVMKLDTVPEFWTFLHSENVSHLAHQCWILRVMSNGLRARPDFELCLKVVAFKLLPSFYSCCLSNAETKFHILRCLRSAVQDQYGACCLVRDYAVISWLHQATLNLHSEDTRLISEMVLVTKTLWRSLLLPQCISVPNIPQPGHKILPLVCSLLPKMSSQLGASTLAQFISFLHHLIKTLPSELVKYFFSSKKLITLVDLCSSFIENKRELYEICELGCKFVDPDLSTQSLVEQEVVNEIKGSERIILRNSLKHLAIMWVDLKESADMKSEDQSCSNM